MKVWQCPSDGCETICGRRDKLTRHLKRQHNLSISRNTFDSLCIWHEVPHASPSKKRVQGNNVDEGVLAQRKRSNAMATAQSHSRAPHRTSTPQKIFRKRLGSPLSPAGPSRQRMNDGDPRVIDLCTPSPSRSASPAPRSADEAATRPRSTGRHRPGGGYAMALSPDSTPPPPILRLLESVEGERGDKHGPHVALRGDKPATERAGFRGEHGLNDGQASPIPGDSIPPTSGGQMLGRATQRPHAEIRNPAHWERSGEVSPETTPERESATTTMPTATHMAAEISSRAPVPSSRARTPVERPTIPLRRTRPTWVVRTPTPPIALRSPPTPPVTPEQDTTSSSRPGVHFGSATPKSPGGETSTDEAAVTSEGGADADDELSEDDGECGSLSGSAGMAARFEAERSIEDSPLGKDSEASRDGRVSGMNGVGGLTPRQLDLDRNLDCRPIISVENENPAELTLGGASAAFHASADSTVGLVRVTHDPSAMTSSTTNDVSAEPQSETDTNCDRSESDLNAEEDVEVMVHVLTDSDVDELGSDITQSRDVAPVSSSSIGRAVTEEVDVDWEEASFGYRLPG